MLCAEFSARTANKKLTKHKNNPDVWGEIFKSQGEGMMWLDVANMINSCFFFCREAFRYSIVICLHKSVLTQICLPVSLASAARSGGPLARMGRKLQLTRARHIIDHIPTHVCVPNLFEHVNGPPKRQRWDFDKLMRAVDGGWWRHEFLEVLENNDGERYKM